MHQKRNNQLVKKMKPRIENRTLKYSAIDVHFVLVNVIIEWQCQNAMGILTLSVKIAWDIEAQIHEVFPFYESTHVYANIYFDFIVQSYLCLMDLLVELLFLLPCIRIHISALFVAVYYWYSFIIFPKMWCFYRVWRMCVCICDCVCVIEQNVATGCSLNKKKMQINSRLTVGMWRHVNVIQIE